MTDLVAPGEGIRAVLRATLTERMRARDADAVSAVRTALAAIDNAEAVPAPAEQRLTSGSSHVAVGAGATEVARQELSEEQMRAVVAAEADEFADLSRRLGESGASDPARRAFQQAAMLRFLLDAVAERRQD